MSESRSTWGAVSWHKTRQGTRTRTHCERRCSSRWQHSASIMQEKAVDLASAAATKDGTQAAPDPAPGTGEGAASKVAIVLESDEAVASSSCGRLMGHITRARDLLTAIGFYVICSSSMSLINKVAVVFYPFPNFLLLLQTASGAALPFLGKQLGLVAVDSLERGKIVSFLPCATFYFLGIYTGMHATATMNLDTIIWFRSTLPIGVAVGSQPSKPAARHCVASAAPIRAGLYDE
eukprot:scaffold696_cov417-Prasinococcus_capsulatus_cf.AAC.5